MPTKLSLTTFVDIVSASGTSKATKTRKALNGEEYHPAKDYYKPIRERIIQLHEGNEERSYLTGYLPKVSDKKKINNYYTIIESYSKWLGKKKTKWFTPPHGEYGTSTVLIRVNPELGLKFNGKKHIVKLYFKSEPLSKNKADIIMGLMNSSLKNDSIMSVLDIRQRKLFIPTIEIPMLKETVNAELAYISAFSMIK